MDDVKEFFAENDHFGKLVGVELLDVGEGTAAARLRIGEQHLNGHGVAHGAAVFTVADLAFAAACNSRGQVALAINVSISYIKPGLPGATLTAEAREISCHPKLGTYTVDVKSESGEVLAVFQGLAYRKRQRLETGGTEGNR